MPTVRRKPWIGSKYRKDTGNLLLGESHYGPAEAAGDPDFTRRFIQGYVQGEYNNRYLTMLGSIITGVPGRSVDRNFLQSFSFCNYVPDFMPKAGVAPSSDQWAAGADRLRQTLHELAPAKMIVLGQRLWNAIKRNHPEFEPAPPMQFEWGPWDALRLPRVRGEPLLVTWIKHPSRANRDEWQEVARAFLGATN